MTQNHSGRMRRLVAAGLLPERAGQPVKVWAHISLAELRAMDDGSVLQDQWIGEMAARWAARRAAASEGGSDGGAWLDGKAARAMACDAIITPVVTGDVDPGALDDLVRLCVELDRLDHGTGRRPGPAGASSADGTPAGRGPADSPSREALRQAIIGKTMILLLHSRSGFDLQKPLQGVRTVHRGRIEARRGHGLPVITVLSCMRLGTRPLRL
jgi:hypothetical protein